MLIHIKVLQNPALAEIQLEVSSSLYVLLLFLTEISIKGISI